MSRFRLSKIMCLNFGHSNYKQFFSCKFFIIPSTEIQNSGGNSPRKKRSELKNCSHIYVNVISILEKKNSENWIFQLAFLKKFEQAQKIQSVLMSSHPLCNEFMHLLSSKKKKEMSSLSGAINRKLYN